MKTKTMAIGKFKAHCLAVVAEVSKKRQPVLLTKRGRPIAKVVPVIDAGEDDIFGFFEGKGEILGDVVSPALALEEWGDLA